MYYKETDAADAEPSRRDQHTRSVRSSTAIPAPGSGSSDVPKKTGTPKYLFSTADSLIKYCREHNLTIAQVVWENELAFRTEEEIRDGLHSRECGQLLSRCDLSTSVIR